LKILDLSQNAGRPRCKPDAKGTTGLFRGCHFEDRIIVLHVRILFVPWYYDIASRIAMLEELMAERGQSDYSAIGR